MAELCIIAWWRHMLYEPGTEGSAVWVVRAHWLQGSIIQALGDLAFPAYVVQGIKFFQKLGYLVPRAHARQAIPM